MKFVGPVGRSGSVASFRSFATIVVKSVVTLVVVVDIKFVKRVAKLKGSDTFVLSCYVIAKFCLKNLVKMTRIFE